MVFAAIGLVFVAAVAVFFALKRLQWQRRTVDAFSFDVPTGAVHDSRPRWVGDDVADHFLARHGPLHVYDSHDVARELGLRDLVLPAWLDVAKAERGLTFQRVWCAEAMGCGLAAIVESVGFVPGNKILMETRRMADTGHSQRRLLETGNFSLDCIQFGLKSDSVALDTVARVRLLHAMARKHVRDRPQLWNSAKWGEPVNQEDSLHTLFMLSCVVVRALEIGGVRVSQEDRDGISMFWAHAGLLLGINEEFLPRSYAEECRMYACHRRESFAPDDAARQLANACIVGACDLAPFYFGFSFLSAQVRNALGSETAALFGIKETGVRDKMALLLIWMLNIVKQLYDDAVGLGVTSSVLFVRKAIEQGLSKQGPCRYRFSLVKRNRTSEMGTN